ncbi:hypothetical protein F4774DRAFT_401197 [Daldinia eschscholtzii]|nr:hypothetical protein F4774DRAFT_401197 [Daldinia eschscholtzii]
MHDTMFSFRKPRYLILFKFFIFSVYAPRAFSFSLFAWSLSSQGPHLMYLVPSFFLVVVVQPFPAFSQGSNLSGTACLIWPHWAHLR